jgi:argininosuccinate lyase
VKAVAPVWSTRTGTGQHPLMERYAGSIADDAPFVEHDLAGSIAHVRGLERAGLLSMPESTQLVGGLQQLHRDWLAGTWKLEPSLEDGHMNIEAELTARLGDVAKRLHTGRSRNDQVATCLVLHARAGLLELAVAGSMLARALAAQAEAHASTPWAARTHGQPAQPATLGFLLLAHAWRIHDACSDVLDAWHAVGESPLGSGAVAGSTLPLDCAYTAGLLGLRPPRNALLATGTRDATRSSLAAAATMGLATASLAQELLELYAAKALRLPPGFTTGSSLMPHKRNPDSLELARGHSRSLGALAAQVEAIVVGLPLGYHRDFQLVKPVQHAALERARDTCQILAACIEGADFDGEALAHAMQAPGLTATDAAEALVQAGMPFRDAYRAVAHAYAEAEKGTDIQAALTALNLSPQATALALAAFAPDPSRRATLGGPAPLQVRAALGDFHQRSTDLAARIAAARHAVQTAAQLTRNA